MSFRALSFSSIEGSTYGSFLALLQCSCWLTSRREDDVTLPEHGPCAGHWVTILMTTFLIDSIILLIFLALNEVKITITNRFVIDILISLIGDFDAQVSIRGLGIAEAHQKLMETSLTSAAISGGIRSLGLVHAAREF